MAEPDKDIKKEPGKEDKASESKEDQNDKQKATKDSKDKNESKSKIQSKQEEELRKKTNLEKLNENKMQHMIENNNPENIVASLDDAVEEPIYSKRKLEDEPFSFWSADTYFHKKYENLNIVFRYFLEIFVISIFLIGIPLLALFLYGEKLPLSRINTSNWSKLSTPQYVLKTNIFFLTFYIADTLFLIISECSTGILTKIIDILQLNKSEFIWSVVQTTHNNRTYLRSACSLYFLFLVLVRAYGPYTTPTLSLRIDSHIIKALVLWLSIYFLMLFIVRFIVHLQTFDIKRSAYKNMIWEANYQTFIFKKLLMIGESHDDKDYVKQISKEYLPPYDPGYYIVDLKFFVSKEDAKTVANNIFALLKLKTLSYEQIKKYFPENHEHVFKYLSSSEMIGEKPKPVKLKQFVNLASQLYNRRKDIIRTLCDRDAVFDKLDLVFGIITTYAAFIILLFLFKVDYKLFITSVGTSLITVSWVFADSIKTIYKCFIFLLIVRPYDIGDNVKINDEVLTVFKIDLLTSTFLTQFNKIVYYPNDILSNVKIYNVARSPAQIEVIELTVDESTTYEQALELAEKVEKELKNALKNSTKCYFKEINGGGKLFYTIEHIKNFQNTLQMKKNHEKIIKAFIKTLDSEGITYKNSFVFTD